MTQRLLSSLISPFQLFWIACTHPFITVYLFLRQLPILVKTPNLFQIIFYLWRTQHKRRSRIKQEKKALSYPKENLIYGETTFLAINEIFTKIELKKNDIFIDCGSGTGKLLFYIHHLHNLETVGYELIPTYVKTVHKIISKYKIKGVICEQVDFLNKGLDKSLEKSISDHMDRRYIVFIAGTCFNDESIKILTRHCSLLKKGTIIITTSYPLKASNIKNLHSFTTWFDWGRGHIYIHHVV